VKPKAAVAAGKNVKRQFQNSWLSDFSWLVYENGLMTCKFCKTFPSMAGLMVKNLTWRNMTQQKISKLGLPERGKYWTFIIKMAYRRGHWTWLNHWKNICFYSFTLYLSLPICFASATKIWVWPPDNLR
jgi:hypothetical protein